jgi:hypothetical protein
MQVRSGRGWRCVAAVTGLAAISLSFGHAQQALPDSATLVREVVYNELHDHGDHGYWRYWVERRSPSGTLTEEQIETPEGPMTRTEQNNGRPLSAAESEAENARIRHLLSSASEQAEHRKTYADDEARIGRILALLPDAFLYEPAKLEGGNYHMRFHPNPSYPAHSIEARIFHAMSGDIWVSAQSKHLVKLDGKVGENVDFGYGILGRLYKDGWFELERTEVGKDWKTQRLEVHMAGRAMLFKSIARETSETRGGFTPVPAGLTLAQAASMIGQPDEKVTASANHGSLPSTSAARVPTALLAKH